MKILNALPRKNSDDLFNVTGYVLKTLKVNFTRDKLYKTVRNHADYPSLLTLKDTFSSFGIHSEAISKAQTSGSTLCQRVCGGNCDYENGPYECHQYCQMN